jgi:hypothetical protein
MKKEWSSPNILKLSVSKTAAAVKPKTAGSTEGHVTGTTYHYISS